MFEELLGLVGDNAEAKAAVLKIKTDYNSKKDTIESLTTQFNDAKQSRDSYKKGNQLVKKALGLENINEEAISEKLEALTKGDDKSKQLQELAQQLASKDEEIQKIKGDYSSKMDTFKIDLELAKGIDAISDKLVDDPLLRDAFKGIVSGNIGKVGDDIVPFQMIGDIKTPIAKEGKAITVSDYLSNVISDDKFASFRKASVPNGTGGTGGKGEQSPKPNTKEADLARAKELMAKR